MTGPDDQPDSRPYAWVVPGDDTANANGFIDARISREGEFTKPLYERPAPEPVAPSSKERLIELALWFERGGNADMYRHELITTLREYASALSEVCRFCGVQTEPARERCCELCFQKALQNTAAARAADEPPANPMGRDADWVLAIGHALGLDSGYKVPIVPKPEVFRELFDEVRRRASQPPTEILWRNTLGNLVAAVERMGRRPETPVDLDVQFAMREARQMLGGLYAETKPATHMPACPICKRDDCRLTYEDCHKRTHETSGAQEQ